MERGKNEVKEEVGGGHQESWGEGIPNSRASEQEARHNEPG